MSIKVDTQSMLACAQIIDNFGGKLTELTNDAYRSVKSLSDSWVSHGATAFTQAYCSFQSRAESLCSDVLSNYSLLLRKAATDGYDYTETGLNNSASKFSD